MGVTGADVRDNMTSYYKMVCYGKVPKVLIWSVDPWVLYGDEAAFDKRADVELYNEFLTKVLGVETDYEEEDRVALWKALVEPAYFQGNVDYYLKNRGQSVVTDDNGNPIDFNPVDGDPYEQPTTIKRSDGSVLYDPAFRDANTDQVRALAAEACPTFNSVHMEGFDSLSPKQKEAFDKFIQYARNQGTTVILALSPWHPYLYDFLLTETDQHQGFLKPKTGSASMRMTTIFRCTAVMTPPALRGWMRPTFSMACTARAAVSPSSSPVCRRCCRMLKTTPCPTPSA